MRISYTLLDPTGNVTVLAQMLPPEKRRSAADRLMAAEPSCEQVGFVSFPERAVAELEMAGGEFCGNATMSAGALCALRQDVSEITVRASGAEMPLAVTAHRRQDGAFDASCTLPLPLSVTQERLPAPDGTQIVPVVRFPGIAHAVVPSPYPRQEAERRVRRWCDLLRADGMGIMFWDEAAQTLTPLVYVPAADTLFWESSCASGTAAVGAWAAHRAGKPVSLSLRQPGGTLRIDAERDRLVLHGTVRIVKTGELE